MARNRPRSGGFTLIELMVVVAIIGILTTAAVMVIDPGKYSGSVKGFAGTVASRMDIARQRATTTQKFQRILIYDDQVIHEQATTEGMGTDYVNLAWEEVARVYAPREVMIYAATTVILLNSGVLSPAAGLGLPYQLEFGPDGAVYSFGMSQGGTVFFCDENLEDQTRVVVYPATGMTHVFEQW